MVSEFHHPLSLFHQRQDFLHLVKRFSPLVSSGNVAVASEVRFIYNLWTNQVSVSCNRILESSGRGSQVLMSTVVFEKIQAIVGLSLILVCLSPHFQIWIRHYIKNDIKVSDIRAASGNRGPQLVLRFQLKVLKRFMFQCPAQTQL